jgi:hypothetical protein
LRTFTAGRFARQPTSNEAFPTVVEDDDRYTETTGILLKSYQIARCEDGEVWNGQIPRSGCENIRVRRVEM